MSDEEDNIDIEIDVAYKWDVIHSPSLEQRYALRLAGDATFSLPRLFSLKHNSITDRAVARLIVNACVSDGTPIAAST